jgi:hypothetical protein
VYPTLAGVDGPTVVHGQYVRIARGATATLVATFRLPPGLTEVLVEPTARIPATRWRLDGIDVAVDKRRTFRL